MGLLDDLERAQRDTDGSRGTHGCRLCRWLDTLDENVQGAARRAAAGTMGVAKLAAVLKKNGATDPESGESVGRRSIEKHRREGHDRDAAR